MPDELVPYALELRDAHAAVEHARKHASRDELNSGLYDRLSEDAFLAAHAFAIELRRLEGRDVRRMERQFAHWRDERDLDDAVPHADRIAAVRVETEAQVPAAIEREVQQTIDNRRAMRQALGRPTREHREFSEELRRRWGRTL